MESRPQSHISCLRAPPSPSVRARCLKSQSGGEGYIGFHDCYGSSLARTDNAMDALKLRLRLLSNHFWSAPPPGHKGEERHLRVERSLEPSA